jgi:nicotinamide-nucleotide amidase
MNAEIIAVGSELLTPFRLDTNSLFLTDQLNRLGIRVMRKVVVGDDRRELSDAFRESLGRVEVVVSCGGLGPTEDDLTRETVAQLLGRQLLRDDSILLRIEERFHRFGRVMPQVNVRQAMVPEGAVALDNPRGTAPGLWLEANGRIVILLPGPPSELKPMFEKQVLPRLAPRSGDVRLYTRELRITGMGESAVEERVAPIYTQYAQAETTILASPGENQLHPRVWSSDAVAAEKTLDEMVTRMALALGRHVFSTAGESMEEVVARELLAHGATIAVAESCTGGLLAERLTRVPGSSAYFLGGAVVYSNDLKSDWADVPAEIVAAHGAVSPEVAIALATGIRRKTAATLGLGVTGIAGPGGATPQKPLGTVHIALADTNGARHRAFRFPGDRDIVRQQAAQAALDMVRRYFLVGAPGED